MAATELPPLEVAVVAYGRPDLLAATLSALGSGSAGSPAYPVLVVDNSSDPEVEATSRAAGARYLDPGRNLGFATAVNLAVANLDSAVSDVLLLNPDATIDPVAVERLHRCLHTDARTACVAPAQRSPDGEEQQVEWYLPTPVRSWADAFGLGRLLKRGDRFIIGSVLLIRRCALDEVGPFDEDFFLYGEEQDWQRRALNAGWQVRMCPEVEARHVGAATSSSDPTFRDKLFAGGHERYTRKWHGAAGWQSARGAVITGNAMRAAVLSGDRRRDAARRARLYGRGPLRSLQDDGRSKAGSDRP